MEILAGPFGLIVVLFLIVLCILWTILPFAVFGIKKRLDEMIRLLKYGPPPQVEKDPIIDVGAEII